MITERSKVPSHTVNLILLHTTNQFRDDLKNLRSNVFEKISSNNNKPRNNGKSYLQGQYDLLTELIDELEGGR